MIGSRLLKWAVIVLIGLYSTSVYAANNCASDLQATGIVDPNCQQTDLQGSWWAIPGKLIPPKMIEQYQADAIPLDVPGYWLEEQVKVNANYPRGLITLWADIKLSGLNTSGENLALWPGRQSSAIRIYVYNGRGSWSIAYDNLSPLVYESEFLIETLPEAGAAGLLHSGLSFQLPKLYSGSRIVLQLYVDDYRTGGIEQSPQIGLRGELYRNIMQRTMWHLLFLGASLLIIIFSASQVFFSASRRSKHLFLILISLGTSLRLLVTGGILIYFFPELTVKNHTYLSWISFLFLLGIFIGAQVFMLPMIFKRHPVLRKVLLGLSVIPIILLALIPLLNLHDFLLIGHKLRTFYIIAAFSYAVFLTWKVCTKYQDQWLQLLGVIMILISGVYDAQLYMQNLDPYIELFAIAMFTFITSQVIYFGWEHMKLFGREQRLSLNLKDLNESLENQVRNRTHDLQTANVRLALAATTDSLTNLPNRRAFDKAIEDEINKAQNNDQALCLAIADVDWFKSVNDSYGHDFGDKVLQAIATYLNKRLRSTDFVARIGGEEFAIILPLTSINSANELLNQICTGITSIRVGEADEYQFSISIGCTQWTDGLSIDELYQLADRGLYKAKSNGRARVEIYQ